LLPRVRQGIEREGETAPGTEGHCYNQDMARARASRPASGPDQRVQLLSALPMAVAGWMGVALLLIFTTPTLAPRWAFFFLLFIALVGTAWPIVWYLNRRFSPQAFPGLGVLWREAMIAGLWGEFLVWLQVGRLLTALTLGSLTVAFFAVEFLLRTYERSRWAPSSSPPEETHGSDAGPEGDDAR